MLAVALLSGRMHYCADEDGDYIDPYNVLPKGETISKSWCAPMRVLGVHEGGICCNECLREPGPPKIS